jgi:hypothetical protein
MRRQRRKIRGGRLGGKKHCIKRNKKKVHPPDIDSSGLSQAKDAATSLRKLAG